MSAFGGDGVVESQQFPKFDLKIHRDGSFKPKRFKAGGGLKITGHDYVKGIKRSTCVLCGGISTKSMTSEHPLPQWLHKFAGDVGEDKVDAFRTWDNIVPTWRQACLASHAECNSTFAKKIEGPASSAIKAIFGGANVTSQQIDAVFNWLDKILSSSAHMGTAMRGHNLGHIYKEHSFPNIYVGLFDRIALFFRVNNDNVLLDISPCSEEAFLTTPSSLFLQIRDICIVYTSSNFLLSKAFGLGLGGIKKGKPEYVNGTGRFAAGLGSRITRLHGAKIIAQPMRRQAFKEGFPEKSDALHSNGDGKLHELIGCRWQRLRSTNFSSLPSYSSPIGFALASLEVVEWLMLCKEEDLRRYGMTENSHFMPSYKHLGIKKIQLLDMISSLRFGMKPPTNDRL